VRQRQGRVSPDGGDTQYRGRLAFIAEQYAGGRTGCTTQHAAHVIGQRQFHPVNDFPHPVLDFLGHGFQKLANDGLVAVPPGFVSLMNGCFHQLEQGLMVAGLKIEFKVHILQNVQQQLIQTALQSGG